ncbi:unnamed protein product [Xyrichtys novacula]|uniref:Unnamed protein product n=1 Tax=Xyrichtys novacula TaxID=13765 RepID=A0AAV1H779_XYRNO|nr:unnamed protein product [Xyrichtys novacula]
MVSLVFDPRPAPSLLLRSATLLTPGAPAGQSGCTSRSVGPHQPEIKFHWKDFKPDSLKLHTAAFLGIKGSGGADHSSSSQVLAKKRRPTENNREDKGLEDNPGVCRFGVVHGNVHMVPAGKHCIGFNITPRYSGPWRPSMSLDMALFGADAPLKTPARGSGAEGSGLWSAAN